MPTYPIDELSDRERQILVLLATGASNKEIAQTLSISANTVKVHVRNVFTKVEVNTRTEAALFAVRSGLVSAEEVNLTLENGPDKAGLEDEPVSISDLIAEGERVTGIKSILTELDEASAFRQRRKTIWLFAVGILVLLGLTGLALIQVYMRGRAITAVNMPVLHWQDLSVMPDARADLALVTYGEQVYAIGGKSAQGASSLVERYDTVTFTWSRGADKKVPVSEVGAVVIGGLIYVPGGRGSDGAPTDVLEVYDPRLDTWQDLAPLPSVLSAYAITSFEGQLYLFGGWNGKEFSNQVYAYDPGQNKWKTLTSMPTRRGYAGAAVSEDKIYVIGGADGQQTLSVNEVYQPYMEGSENAWTKAAPLPFPDKRMAVASVADIIHIFGGEASQDGPLPVLTFLPRTQQWQSIAPPTGGLPAGLGAAPLGPNVYLVGGESGQVLSGRALVYQPIFSIAVPIIIK